MPRSHRKGRPAERDEVSSVRKHLDLVDSCSLFAGLQRDWPAQIISHIMDEDFAQPTPADQPATGTALGPTSRRPDLMAR